MFRTTDPVKRVVRGHGFGIDRSGASRQYDFVSAPDPPDEAGRIWPARDQTIDPRKSR